MHAKHRLRSTAMERGTQYLPLGGWRRDAYLALGEAEGATLGEWRERDAAYTEYEKFLSLVLLSRVEGEASARCLSLVESRRAQSAAIVTVLAAYERERRPGAALARYFAQRRDLNERVVALIKQAYEHYKFEENEFFLDRELLAFEVRAATDPALALLLARSVEPLLEVRIELLAAFNDTGGGGAEQDTNVADDLAQQEEHLFATLMSLLEMGRLYHDVYDALERVERRRREGGGELSAKNETRLARVSAELGAVAQMRAEGARRDDVETAVTAVRHSLQTLRWAGGRAGSTAPPPRTETTRIDLVALEEATEREREAQRREVADVLGGAAAAEPPTRLYLAGADTLRLVDRGAERLFPLSGEAVRAHVWCLDSELFILPSAVPGGGEGLFARYAAEPGQVLSYMDGVEVGAGSVEEGAYSLVPGRLDLVVPTVAELRAAARERCVGLASVARDPMNVAWLLAADLPEALRVPYHRAGASPLDAFREFDRASDGAPYRLEPNCELVRLEVGRGQVLLVLVALGVGTNDELYYRHDDEYWKRYWLRHTAVRRRDGTPYPRHPADWVDVAVLPITPEAQPSKAEALRAELTLRAQTLRMSAASVERDAELLDLTLRLDLLGEQ